MDKLPNAAEVIERLARECERLKIKVEKLEADKAELQKQTLKDQQ